MTGKQIANIRDYLVTEDGNNYKWDFFDGLEDSLDCIPVDLQEKVKRAVRQGHVDDEDFNGVCTHSCLVICGSC